MACGSCDKPKKLTIGIPVYDDYRAAALTIQSVRLHGAVSPDDLDVLVVDNHPESAEGNALREFCASAGVRYATCKTIGTAAPRDAVFSNSLGEIVCAIDSHVLLAPGALAQLVEFADANPKSLDLWHGPLVYDPLKPGEGICSMRPEWGDDLMFGKWADTQSLPADSAPLEIPMHGLGLVACRKSAWVRSPAGLRGFGGCEGMIHERWRQMGRRVLCLPFLRWWHLFHRQTEPTKYPNTYEDRCRNYLIWALSLKLPTAEIVERFGAKFGAGRVALLLAEAEKAHAPAKERKGIVRKAWNYAQAVAAHRLAGSPSVTEIEFRERLEECEACELRIDDECGACGCPIDAKAKWREQTCPHPSGARWRPLLPGAGAGAASTAAPAAIRTVTRELQDSARCEHRQLISSVRVERSDAGGGGVAKVTVQCRACGTVAVLDGQSEGRLALSF